MSSLTIVVAVACAGALHQKPKEILDNSVKEVIMMTLLKLDNIYYRYEGAQESVLMN